MNDLPLPTMHRPLETAVLRFDRSAMDSWAAFSGDYNPVHFDLGFARAVGLGGVIVHGMLALLPVKQMLSQAIDGRSSLAGDAWLKFRAVFRNPIRSGKDSFLHIRDCGPRLDFQVRAAESDQEQFRGSFAHIEPPLEPMDAVHSGDVLDTTLLAERIAELATTAPNLSEAWIALDAIVFSEFIRHKLGDIERMVLPLLSASTADKEAGAVVYQLSHAVRFRSDLLHRYPAELGRLGPVTYSMPNAIDATCTTGQAVGTVGIPVVDAAGPLMTLEIGLMARTMNNRSE